MFDVNKKNAIITRLGINSVLKNAGVKEGDRIVSFGLLKENKISFITIEEEIQKYVGRKLALEILTAQESRLLKYEIELKN